MSMPAKFKQYVADPALFLADLIVDRNGDACRLGDCGDTWQWLDFQSAYSGMKAAAGMPVVNPCRRVYLERSRGHSKSSDTVAMLAWVLIAARGYRLGYLVAVDKDQSGLNVDAFTRLVQLNPWLSELLDVQKTCIRLIAPGHPGKGSEIRVLSCDTASSFGIRPDFVFADELSHWPRRDLWESIISSVAKKKNCLLIVASNAPIAIPNDWRWLAREAFEKSPGVYFSSQPGCVASWISQATLAEQKELLTPAAFRRYWMNEPISGAENPLIPHDVVVQAVRRCLWSDLPRGELAPAPAPVLFLGIDIGRTRDRSVIITLEMKGPKLIVREIFTMHNTPFAQQKAEIRKRMTPSVRKVGIDKGGIGMQLHEEMVTEFGNRIEGFQLNSAVQGKVATRIKTIFDQHEMVLPDDCDLRADIALIESCETYNGVPVIRTGRSIAGHGDRAWALFLAAAVTPLHQEQRTGGGKPRAVALGGRDGSLPFVPGMAQSSRFGFPLRGAMGRDQ